MTTAERPDVLRGILFMLLCVLIFGLMDALVKLATERHPIGQIVFFRNLFAFMPLSFFIRQAGGLADRCAPARQPSISCARSPASPAWSLTF